MALLHCSSQTKTKMMKVFYHFLLFLALQTSFCFSEDNNDNMTSYIRKKPFKRKDKKGCRPGENSVEAQFRMQSQHLRSIRGGDTRKCENKKAAGFSCNCIDLEGFLSLDDLNFAQSANDIWGWTDRETNKEYAIIGLFEGTAFVDISSPNDPKIAAFMRSAAQGFGNSWRDIKTYKNYAYVVSEANGHGLQIYDMSNLRNITGPIMRARPTSRYSSFGSAHNIFINEDSGFAYVVGSNRCRGGLYMLNLSNPKKPKYAGCFSSDGYTHDVECVLYDGPDENYLNREICFASNEDSLTIIDVTTKDAATQISKYCHPSFTYTHQGWLTNDRKVFILDDELDNTGGTKTFIIDVSTLSQPNMIKTHVSPLKATDHNQYILNGYSYQANYRAGLRIMDLVNVASGDIAEVAYFDVYQADNQFGFNGAWSVFPYFDSGLVVVSGIEQGLFVLRPTALADDESELYIANLTASFANDTLTESSAFDFLTMKVVVSIHDETDSPIENVQVNGSFNLINRSSCTTDTTGTCVLKGDILNRGPRTVTFDINEITLPKYRYNSSKNKVEATIKLTKPNDDLTTSQGRIFLKNYMKKKRSSDLE